MNFRFVLRDYEYEFVMTDEHFSLISVSENGIELNEYQAECVYIENLQDIHEILYGVLEMDENDRTLH